KNQASARELLESGLQCEPGHRSDGLEQSVRELATDCSADLGSFFDRAEPVKARHQRIVQRGRNSEVWQRTDGDVAITFVSEQPRLQHHLGELLDEERNPVGLAVIGSSTSRGNSFPPARSRIMAAALSRASRSISIIVTCARSSHGGKNSGLKVIRRNTRAVLIASMNRLVASSVEGSIQCASSIRNNTGFSCARLITW